MTGTALYAFKGLQQSTLNVQLIHQLQNFIKVGAF